MVAQSFPHSVQVPCCIPKRLREIEAINPSLGKPIPFVARSSAFNSVKVAIATQRNGAFIGCAHSKPARFHTQLQVMCGASRIDLADTARQSLNQGDVLGAHPFALFCGALLLCLWLARFEKTWTVGFGEVGRTHLHILANKNPQNPASITSNVSGG